MSWIRRRIGLDELEELLRLPLGFADDEDVREDLVVALVQLVEEHVDCPRAVGCEAAVYAVRRCRWLRPRVEVVHVGSACRDLAPDDPRGWRLGGGVTYAALTTARLGLRTAAIIGVDATAATAQRARPAARRRRRPRCSCRSTRARSSTTSRRPTGRVQTCLAVGRAAPVPATARVVARRAGLVAGAGRRRGRRRLGGGRSRRAPTSPSAGRASCATWRPGSRFAADRRAPSAIAAPGRPRRGQPSRRRRPRRPSPSSDGFLRPGRRPARHPGRATAGCWSGVGADGPVEIAALPADRDRPRERPDRRGRHVPGRAPGVDPAARGRRPDAGPATGSTCASRRPPGRSSWRGRVSAASRIGGRPRPPGARTDPPRGRSRARSPRWARSRRPDRLVAPWRSGRAADLEPDREHHGWRRAARTCAFARAPAAPSVPGDAAARPAGRPPSSPSRPCSGSRSSAAGRRTRQAPRRRTRRRSRRRGTEPPRRRTARRAPIAMRSL